MERRVIEMKTIILDVSAIYDRNELHSSIRNALDLPEWYGMNLDALHDCLTDISEETVVYIINYDLLAENIGEYADRFRRMFLMSQYENRMIKAIFL